MTDIRSYFIVIAGHRNQKIATDGASKWKPSKQRPNYKDSAMFHLDSACLIFL